jgi:eukaryotic-like serine/threonine-protein kinase
MTEEEVFHEALSRSPEDLAAYLQQACAGNPAMRSSVEALLRANIGASRFLEAPAIAPQLLATVEGPIDERPGTVIGPYKLLEQIGEGGFGVVFMAEQQQTVRRKVALKVLKPGMDTRQIIARFEAERQVLALMNHPNIAQVFDGGTTATGRPFFVMELVHGIPITEFCDDSSLAIRERLGLFVDVCQAVQHAHQKGIIHRDIKPTNVMVTLHDGQPVVKVIDFGIAKAMGQQLTEKTLFTNFAQMIGTPLYMSPEQAELSGLDIDTRGDVYSLGVMLYELLTGTTPFENERLKKVGYDEMRRIIREEQPLKPSARISTVGKATRTASAKRQSEPRQLGRLFRGELDWIVMKALEKDRNRRYATANAFALDVKRYLNDEQVLACPPSASYRLRKFARRNRPALAIAGLVLFFIALLGAAMGWMVHDWAARVHTVREQVIGILDEADQWQEQEKWPEASSAVQRAEGLLAGVSGQSELHQRVRNRRQDVEMVLRLDSIMHDLTSLRSSALGFDFQKLDARYDEAFREYGIDVKVLESERAVELICERPIRLQLALGLDAWAEARRFVHDPSWQDLLAIAAAADPDQWRGQVRAALRNQKQAALVKAAGQIPIDQVPAVTLGLLGRALNDVGGAKEGEALLRQAQRLHPDSFWLNFDLAMSLLRQKPPQSQEAVRFLSAALALQPESLVCNARLGDALLQAGKQEEALTVFDRVIELNPKSAAAWISRGLAYAKLRQYDRAIADFTQAIELDPTAFRVWTQRANAYYDSQQYDNALTDHDKAIALDPASSWARLCRGVAYATLRQYDQAIIDYSKAVELDPNFAAPWIHRGTAYADLRQFDKAIADFSKALELDPTAAKVWTQRANAYYDSQQYDKALCDHGQAIALDPTNSFARMCRGVAYATLQQYDQAIIDYSKAVELDPNYEMPWINRGAAYADLHQYDKAIADYGEGLRISPQSAQAHNALAWLLATCPDPTIRDLPRAVQLATQAVELDPQVGNNWHTLGTAHYYAGEWKGAVIALEKSMELRNGGNSFDWFFLAMAHWQLGDKEQARERYDQALQWMDSNRPQDAELGRFRAEAAALLGVKETED